MSRSKRDKRRALSGAALEVAARLFAFQNMGQGTPKPLTARGVRNAWAQLSEVSASEGMLLDDELKDWRKNFAAGDVTTLDMWDEDAALRPLRVELAGYKPDQTVWWLGDSGSPESGPGPVVHHSGEVFDVVGGKVVLQDGRHVEVRYVQTEEPGGAEVRS